MADGDAHALFGATRLREVALERLQITARVLAEDVDEQVFLAVEVQVDRAVGDTGRFCNVRYLGIEVAALRENVGCGPENALPLRCRWRLRLLVGNRFSHR